MNKSDLVQKVYESEDVDLTKRDAGKFVDAMLDVMYESLSEKEEVPLGKIGKLKVAERPAREYRDPQNGGTVHKPAHNVVKFKQGKNMKENLNGQSFLVNQESTVSYRHGAFYYLPKFTILNKFSILVKTVNQKQGEIMREK